MDKKTLPILITDSSIRETLVPDKEGRVIPTKCRLSLWWAFAAFALLVGGAVHAQQWTGEIGGGYIWQNVSGSENSYRSQFDEQTGFLLDGFHLAYAPKKGAPERFSLKAWGFGNAEPDEHVLLTYSPVSAWKFNLNYDRRDSFFDLDTDDMGGIRNDWNIDRWTGRIRYDGWSALRLSLIFRYVHRGGTVDRPLYGLAQFYPMRVDLDENMKEATVRLETKDFPVHILFEQSQARYEREDRWAPLGSFAYDATDPDVLYKLKTDRMDKQDVPTSRLMAAYRGHRVEIVGAFMYSSIDLHSTGTAWQGFGIGGGQTGTVTYIDNLISSAQQDVKAGKLHLGFDLGAGWILRLSSDYRNTTADSNQIGERLIRIANPSGWGFDLSNPVNESGVFDVKDQVGRLELEHRGANWSVWGGAFTGTRDVSWRRTNNDPGEDVSRNSKGYLVGASWFFNRSLILNGEYRHGTFQQYIFRTEPEEVNRLTLRLRSDLGKGWAATARIRTERSDNPKSVSNLDHSSDAFGFTVGWNSKDGSKGFGFDVDKTDFSTDTGILLPGNKPGLSRYDLNLITLGLHGQAKLGRVLLFGNIVRLRDSGRTWPLRSWSGLIRATLAGPKRTEFSLFAQYRTYHQSRNTLDDFNATRYGLTIRWRF